MKRANLASALLATSATLTSNAFAYSIPELNIQSKQLRISVSPDRRTLKIQSPDKSWTCKVTDIQGDNKTISALRLNYEESALILTSVDYLALDTLHKCNNATAAALRIPPKAGFLVDINLRHQIYLALDTVQTSPFAYVAIVAKLGSTKLLVDLPGAYSPRSSLKQLQKHAFSYSPEEESPRISLDGRYVSPAGLPDCGGQPGVWDLKTKKAVVFPKLAEHEAAEKCAALFAK
jgi:hypothetical protein